MSDESEQCREFIKRIKKNVERCSSGMLRLLDNMDTNFKEGKILIKITNEDINDIGELNDEIAGSMKDLLEMILSMKEISEKMEAANRVLH